MKYKSCLDLEVFGLLFGNIVDGVRFCCTMSPEMRGKTPVVELSDNPAQTMQELIELRANIIANSIRCSLSHNHKGTLNDKSHSPNEYSGVGVLQ